MAMFGKKEEKSIYNRAELAPKNGNIHIAVYTITSILMGGTSLEPKVTAIMDRLLQDFQFDGYEIVDVKISMYDNQFYAATVLYK